MTKYLVVALVGDSNGFSGALRATDGTDNAGANIFTWNQAGSIVVADEPLDFFGADRSINHACGSTVAYCRLLRDHGFLPSGWNFLIVPCSEGGTSFVYDVNGGPAGWSNVDNSTGNPGPSLARCVSRLNAAMAAAKASDASSHAHSLVYNEGYNNAANVLINAGVASYSVQHAAMAAYIRAQCADFRYCPWLEIPAPWYPGGAGHDSNHFLEQRIYKSAIATTLECAVYVDTLNPPDFLQCASSDGSSPAGIHYSSAAHRGSIGNIDPFPVETAGILQLVAQHPTVMQSIAGLMYTAYFTARRGKVIKYNT